MRIRTPLAAFSFTLLAALGLSACGSTSEDGGGPSAYPCTNPMPAVAGKQTGYEQCEGGWRHRPEAVECPSDVPRAGYTCTAGGTGCSTDADCATTPNGYCNVGQGGCYCAQGCKTDADCASGQICECNAIMGQCVAATCTSDADCKDGNLCGSYDAEPSCGQTTYACQTAADGCASNADCPAGLACSMGNGHRTCVQAGCAIGRPFLVGGSERLAEPAARGDWCADIAIDCDALAPELRRALAQRWTEIALMEHASIAAFARFSLQLLSLGVGPELLVETQGALADETEHARIAFALASAYAGRPIGPGPLSLAGALDGAQDLETVLRLTVREGCIGETVAAIEAQEASLHAQDETLRAVLSRIAADEMRHAQLAWRFTAWALDAADGALDHVLDEELRAAQVRSLPQDDPTLLAHGIVGEALRAEIRRQALAQVVGPCARALLGTHQRREAA